MMRFFEKEKLRTRLLLKNKRGDATGSSEKGEDFSRVLNAGDTAGTRALVDECSAMMRLTGTRERSQDVFRE